MFEGKILENGLHEEEKEPLNSSFDKVSLTHSEKAFKYSNLHYEIAIRHSLQTFKRFKYVRQCFSSVGVYATVLVQNISEKPYICSHFLLMLRVREVFFITLWDIVHETIDVAVSFLGFIELFVYSVDGALSLFKVCFISNFLFVPVLRLTRGNLHHLLGREN